MTQPEQTFYEMDGSRIPLELGRWGGTDYYTYRLAMAPHGAFNLVPVVTTLGESNRIAGLYVGSSTAQNIGQVEHNLISQTTMSLCIYPTPEDFDERLTLLTILLNARYGEDKFLILAQRLHLAWLSVPRDVQACFVLINSIKIGSQSEIMTVHDIDTQ